MSMTKLTAQDFQAPLSQVSICGGIASICHADASDRKSCSDTTHYSEVHEFHLYTGACIQYIFAHKLGAVVFSKLGAVAWP